MCFTRYFLAPPLLLGLLEVSNLRVRILGSDRVLWDKPLMYPAPSSRTTELHRNHDLCPSARVTLRVAEIAAVPTRTSDVRGFCQEMAAARLLSAQV